MGTHITGTDPVKRSAVAETAALLHVLLDDLAGDNWREDIERLHAGVDDLAETPALTEAQANQIILLFSEGVCAWADAVRHCYAVEDADRYMQAAEKLLNLVEGLAGLEVSPFFFDLPSDVETGAALDAGKARLRQDIA